MQEKVMVLKAQAMQEDNELYDYFTKDFTFCQTFLLSLWSFLICCCKVCEFFQTLIKSWLKDSLKQFKPPRLEELVLPQEIPKIPKLVPCSPNISITTN